MLYVLRCCGLCVECALIGWLRVYLSYTATFRRRTVYKVIILGIFGYGYHSTHFLGRFDFFKISIFFVLGVRSECFCFCQWVKVFDLGSLFLVDVCL